MTKFRNDLQAQLAEAGIDVSSFERIDVVDEGDDDDDDELIVDADDDDLGDDDDEFGDSDSGDDDDQAEDDEEEDEEVLGDNERGKREFYHLLVPTASAVEIWEKIRSLTEYTGYWPVLTADYAELFEFMGFNDTDTKEIVDRSVRVNITSWLKSKAADEKLSAEMADGAPASKAKATKKTTTNGSKQPKATKAKPNTNGSSEGYHTLSAVNGAHACLVLVPTKTSWHVPAVLKWGGSSNGIKPEYHTAILKKWQDEYGAELVCSTTSVLEMKVDYPPKTEEEALKLAQEQFIYCPDIVRQGNRTVAALANELVESKRWYFCWD
jgi:hypothetical protein